MEDRKIASIGVHVARGVTTHGFAVNVENDLQPFGWVVPCGLEGVQMTSLIKETARRIRTETDKCAATKAMDHAYLVAFCASVWFGPSGRMVSRQRRNVDEAIVGACASTPVDWSGGCRRLCQSCHRISGFAWSSFRLAPSL